MLKLRDIMTRDVITVAPDLSVRDAMDLLASRHIGGVPVVSGLKVLGVVSATDLMAFATSLDDAADERPEIDAEGDIDGDVSAAEAWSWDDDTGPAAAYFTASWDNGEGDVQDRFAAFRDPGGSPLNYRTVADAMTSSVCSLPSTASVVEAAEYMKRSGIHRLLVIDGNDLKGIVSTMDITRAVADHKLVSRTYVFGEPRMVETRERPHSLGSKRPAGH